MAVPQARLAVYREIKVKNLEVYAAKFHGDKPLGNTYNIPDWLRPIQVGAALTQERVADILDNSGENISRKNPNYCELTALYWIWKNRLIENRDCRMNHKETGGRYYGLFHYRRFLDLGEKDLERLAVGDIDVVLPYPTVHEPDIGEHHRRYIKEADWEAALGALGELCPEYYASYHAIFSQEYMYNYNILIARDEVLKRYCEWLFPVLERVEELSTPKGSERKDRYIGYIGESLLTLYFMYHRNRVKIAHTGRIMLT